VAGGATSHSIRRRCFACDGWGNPRHPRHRRTYRRKVWLDEARSIGNSHCKWLPVTACVWPSMCAAGGPMTPPRANAAEELTFHLYVTST
jgi:hypothetical protein